MKQRYIGILALLLVLMPAGADIAQMAKSVTEISGAMDASSSHQLITSIAATDGNLFQSASIETSINGECGTGSAAVNNKIIEIGVAGGSGYQEGIIDNSIEGVGAASVNNGVFQALDTGNGALQKSSIVNDVTSENIAAVFSTTEQSVITDGWSGQYSIVEDSVASRKITDVQWSEQSAVAQRGIIQETYESAVLPGSYVDSTQFFQQDGKSCAGNVKQTGKAIAYSDPEKVVMTQAGIQNAHGISTQQTEEFRATAGGKNVEIAQAGWQWAEAKKDAKQELSQGALIWWADKGTVSQGGTQTLTAGNNGVMESHQSVKNPAKESENLEISLQNAKVGNSGKLASSQKIDSPGVESTKNTVWITQTVSGSPCSMLLETAGQEIHANGKESTASMTIKQKEDCFKDACQIADQIFKGSARKATVDKKITQEAYES